MNLYMNRATALIACVVMALHWGCQSPIANGARNSVENAVIAIHASAVRHFFQLFYKGLPKVVYIIADDSDAAAVITGSKVSLSEVRLKPGRGFVAVGGRLMDPDSNNPCSVVELRLRRNDDVTGDVEVVWTGVAGDFAIYYYTVRKVQDKWKVVNIVEGPVS